MTRVSLECFAKDEARRKAVSSVSPSSRLERAIVKNDRHHPTAAPHANPSARLPPHYSKMSAGEYPNAQERKVLGAAESLMKRAMEKYDPSHDAFHGELKSPTA
jgi:hypothetical protein